MSAHTDEIAGRLADASPEVRRRAVRDLAELPPAEVLLSALAALGDDDWRVRKEAVAVFVGWGGAAEPAPALLAAIEQEENVGLRNAAAEALSQVAGPAIDLVIERLPALLGTSRKIALDVVGRSADPRRSRILSEHLADDDVNLSAAAAELMGEAGGDGVVEALAGCLERNEQMVVLAALQSLNRLGAHLPFERLEPLVAVPLYGSALLEALGRTGDPAAAHPIVTRIPADPMAARALVVMHGSSERAGRAVESAIGSAGKAVLAALSEAAASGDFAARYAAVSCLLWARRTECVPQLVALARDEALHAHVVDGLAAWGAPALDALDAMFPSAQGRALASLIAVTGRLLDLEEGRRRIPLFTAFLNSGDSVVVTAAMGALARFGDAAIVPRLLDLVRAEQERVRRAASRALVQIGRRHPDAVHDALRWTAFEGDRGVELMRVFQEVGRAEDAPLIASALTSPSPSLRRAALGALAAVAGGGAIHEISLSMTDESADVREAAVAALATLGPAASETIVSALHGSEGPLRPALVRALGRVGHPEAQTILKRAMRESAPTAIAALEAAAALGLDPLGTKGELLGHPDTEVVKTAIAALGDTVTDAELVALLCADAWDVRLAAVERLSRRALKPAVLDSIRAALATEEDDLVRAAIERALARRAEKR